MTYHWMCRLLFRSVCLQTTSSAGMALEGVERNDTLAVTVALRMAAKQPTVVITIQAIRVSILNKVLHLSGNMI